MKFRVCLAGSRDLPLAKMPRHVVEQLVDANRVILRCPRSPQRRPGQFEVAVARMAETLGVEVEWHAPEPGGREQVFLRDLSMVGKADRVVCYFAAETMDGGTAHVVDSAITRGIPIEAYHVAGDGTLTRIGEFDPQTDGP
jgi:N-dimethylarginine dimethylaminohydrolase